MNFARVSLVVFPLTACAGGQYATVDPGHPAYVVPHHLAEGKGEGTEARPETGTGTTSPAPSSAAAPASASAAAPGATSAAAPAASGTSRFSSAAPDPQPLSMAEQWQFQLLFQHGAPHIEQIEKQTLPKPVPTPRRMGRFALELWIGRELIDRVRFDFPLIAAEEPPGVTRRPLHDSPSLASNAIARVRVSLPASPRATRLLLVDRATEKIQELPWPPDQTPPAPSTPQAPTAE